MKVLNKCQTNFSLSQPVKTWSKSAWCVNGFKSLVWVLTSARVVKAANSDLV
jgi:hypothetical protein